jgi:predicted nucleotidyltransferase
MTHPKISIQENELATFCRRNQITQLALFGSALSGRFETDSDVDVLVTFAPDAKIGFLAFGRIQRELADLLQHPVDLVPQDGLKPLIRQSILDSAEVIYKESENTNF